MFDVRGADRVDRLRLEMLEFIQTNSSGDIRITPWTLRGPVITLILSVLGRLEHRIEELEAEKERR